MKWQYTIIIVMDNGDMFKDTLIQDDKLNADYLANGLVQQPFMHIVDGNKITIINMSKVHHITVRESQIQF